MLRQLLRIGRREGVVVLLLLGCASGWGAAVARGGEPGTLEFIAARSQRQWPHVERRVMAFYYTWYGRPEHHGRWVHWQDVDDARHDIASSTHYPAKGAYDSHDPEIIDYHIDLAKQAGIDTFICTWWGRDTFDDRALRIVLERAAAKNFQVSIYWETAPGQGRAQVERAVEDLLYVLNRYGTHPAFLKVEGKPVIFVYGRVMNEVALGQWPAIIQETERRFPAGCLLLADGYTPLNARVFDGIHTYNPCGWVQGKDPDALRAASRESFTQAVQTARQFGKISCITVIPGYNDTKIRTPGLNAERQNGDTYRVLWEEAQRAGPDWVLITSWNEWHEGSEIEPSWEDGDKYVRLTAPFAQHFKETTASPKPAGAAQPGLAADQVRRLQQLYRDRPIAILPDYSGDVVFWLADAQVPLAELGWADVVNAQRFNARDYPVALFAGAEHYRQTVDQPGDVDRSLVRYLNQGGLLIVLPSMPLPFYYNEQNQSVASAARFGLPIRAGRGDPSQAPTGWEKPPAELQFTFHGSSALPALPDQVPFPAVGDLRWRPITNRELRPDDIYMPLVKLKDQNGLDWGDAVAYVEHRVSEPVGGKGIYCWMRMPDLLGRDRLWGELFQLAALKAAERRSVQP